MKPQTYTVYDPISNYPFKIESPFPLHNHAYAFHPAYAEPFDKLYKYTKKILLTDEKLYNIQSKRLAMGILLYKLSETSILEFRQFKTLELSYNFFADEKLITKFFYVIPKIIFATSRERKRLPRFRITANQLGSIDEWLSLCIQSFNKIDEFKRSHSYDEAFLKANAIHQRWKLYSKNTDKLHSKVIHYVATVTAIPPESLAKWRIFFEESAGSLYLKHKIRSVESVDLFWELLDCVDHLECSDYQNTLVKSVIRFLKYKVSEWVDWHPQFLELSLDYKLQTPKHKAVEGLSTFWVTHTQEQVAEREANKALAISVSKRLAERRAARDKELRPASVSFDIKPTS